MIGQRTRLYLNTFFAIAFFIVILFSRLAYYSLEAQLILLGVFILVGAIWLTYFIKFPTLLSNSPLHLGWAAILVAITVSSFFSLNPAQSWRLAWSWAVAPAAFFLVLFFLRLKLFSVRFILQTFVAVFSVFLIAGYLEIWQISSAWLATGRLLPFKVGLIHGWTESRNILALFLVWIIAISVGLFSNENNKSRLWFVGIIIPLPLLLLASSAGGYISLLAIIAVLIAGYNAERIEQAWVTLERRQMVIAVIFLAVVSILGATSVIRWLATDPGFADRLYYWELARGTFSQNRLTGMGLGTHITAFIQGPNFQLKHRLFFNPHSFWFTVLADLGIIGVIAVTVWVIQTAGLLAKRYRAILASSQALTLVTCLTAFFVHALIETPRPRLFLIATILLACLLYETKSEPKDRNETQGKSSLWTFVWPLIFIGLGVGLWQSYRVQSRYELGVAQAEEGNWDDAANYFEQADALGLFPETAVLTAATYANATLDLQRLPEKADTSYWEQLIEQEPAWPINHHHLAMMHAHNGDFAAAEASYRRAAELAPGMPPLHLNLAQFYESMTEQEKAEAVYAQLYELPNTWHQAPFWDSISVNNQPIANEIQPCVDRTCFYFNKEELKRAWELLAAGQRNEARTLFEEIQTQEVYASDAAVYFGSYLSGSQITSEFSAEQGFQLASLPTPFFDPFMLQLFLAEDQNEEFVQLRLDRITAHSAQGFGLVSNGDYIRLGYLRSALPHDLLPAVQCFTADDHSAWQLTVLENWYSTNGLETYAKMANDAKLGPNGNGVHSCINRD